MSNENITPEIREYAEFCRKFAIDILKDPALKYYDSKYRTEKVGAALSQYRLCLEIMKLEKEL